MLDTICSNNIELIDIATVIISAVAVCVAIFNVREVKRQRVKMYEPTLIVEGITWRIDDSQVSPIFKIWNVGYGSALEIECSWKLLDSLLGSTHVESIKRELNGFDIKGDKKVEKLVGDVLKAHGYKQSYPHLLPVNVDGNHILLHSPLKPFIDVLGEVKNHSKFEVFLKYELELRYKDINSKTNIKKLIVVIRKEHMQEGLCIISKVDSK